MSPDFIPAKSKQEATARLYAVAGAPPEPLGPGSKEKKSVLTALATALRLDVDLTASKEDLAKQTLARLDHPWDTSYTSRGQTITLAGLNAILKTSEAELQQRTARRPQRLEPLLPEWFQPARHKLEAVQRISTVTGGSPQNLGPGSKERKSVLEDLVRNLRLPLDTRLPKTRLAEAIAATLEMPWNNSCWSTGETITLQGLNIVLAGAEQRVLTGRDKKNSRLYQEARLLVTAAAAAAECPDLWDGYSCVNRMIEGDYTQARQTEWIGWYFEFIGVPALINAHGGGPLKIGSTKFDYAREFVWDLKTHAQPRLPPPSDVRGDVPLNDRDSVLKCVDERGALGFLVLSGRPSFEGHSQFETWHRQLRGKPRPTSKRPRRLKTSMRPMTLQAYVFSGVEATEKALEDQVLKEFHQGTQPGGSPRKLKLKLALKPAQEAGYVIASHNFLN